MKIKQNEVSPSNSLHNTLAIGSFVKGDVVTDGDFRLDGKVEGNICCGAKIVIGPKAHVEGDIVSINAEIMGLVRGNVKTEGHLILKATAEVKGNITTQTLEIEPNATFCGVCDMSAITP